MNNEIKSTIQTKGWEYIEEIIKAEILEGKKPINIKTEGKTAEMIALEVMAREMSAKIINSVLQKVKRIANSKEFSKESWK